MLGTFGGALEARHIDASNGRLTGEITGEVETEDGVLVIRRIHVHKTVVNRNGKPDKHLLRKLQNLAKKAGAKFHTELHKLRKNRRKPALPRQCPAADAHARIRA